MWKPLTKKPFSSYVKKACSSQRLLHTLNFFPSWLLAHPPADVMEQEPFRYLTPLCGMNQICFVHLQVTVPWRAGLASDVGRSLTVLSFLQKSGTWKPECSSESLSHSVLAAVMVLSTKFLKVLDSTWKWPNALYLELDNKISLVYHFKWKANSALPAKNINALLLPAFADVMSKNGLKIGNSSSEIPA